MQGVATQLGKCTAGDPPVTDQRQTLIGRHSGYLANQHRAFNLVSHQDDGLSARSTQFLVDIEQRLFAPSVPVLADNLDAGRIGSGSQSGAAAASLGGIGQQHTDPPRVAFLTCKAQQDRRRPGILQRQTETEAG